MASKSRRLQKPVTQQIKTGAASMDLLLEQRVQHNPLATYHQQLLESHYESYQKLADAAKQKVRLEKKTYTSSGRVQKRKTYESDVDDAELAAVIDSVDDAATTIDSIGEREGFRYLEMLSDFAVLGSLPSGSGRCSEFMRLEEVVRNHPLHSDASLSAQAFRCLTQLMSRFPVAVLARYSTGQGHEGTPYVQVCDVSHSLLGRSRPFVEDVLNAAASPPLDAPKFLAHLFRCALALVASPRDAQALRRNLGEVWVLRAVLSGLETDLRVRLAAFAGTAKLAGDKQVAVRRQDLLRQSQLWRLLEPVASTGLHSKHELVQDLLRIIAAAAGDSSGSDGVGISQPALDFLSAHELASCAALMLNMMLELYGTAEQEKCCAKANERLLLDKCLNNLFISSDCVLESTEQRTALLSVLRPRDRLRLLGTLVAKKRIVYTEHRKSNPRNTPNLTALKDFVNGPGDSYSYPEIDAVELLEYVAADSEPLSKPLVFGGPSDLAIIAAEVAISASSLPDCQSAEQLAGMGEALGSVVKSLAGSTLSMQARTQLSAAQQILDASMELCEA